MADVRASRRSPAEIGALVLAARDDDEGAWNALVDEFGGLVWSVARAHRLNSADAADVSQTTWLRLAEHLGRIREPERVGGWLAATARHECLRLLRRSQRELPLGDDLPEPASLNDPPPGAGLLAQRARDRALGGVRAARRALPDAAARADGRPAAGLRGVGEALDMPVGSIGPTRARCLEQSAPARRRSVVSADALDDSWEVEPA